MVEKKKYRFFRQVQKIKEVITASYDPLKEWHPDPKGYFLIRVNPTKKRLEVGFVTNNHVIIKEIVGKSASEIYMTIVRRKLITRLEHGAYLGKELYKAELALKYGKRYRQEFPLEFSDKAKIKVKDS